MKKLLNNNLLSEQPKLESRTVISKLLLKLRVSLIWT